MIKAIIFDMDGTLLDSEKYFFEARIKASKEFGYERMEEHALVMRGFSSKYAKAYMKDVMGEDFPFDEIRMRRKEIFAEIQKERGIQAKKGAKECLEALIEKGYPIAIATASDPERAANLLKAAGLYQYFKEENIICATNLKRGKPAPDVYLFACDRLGIQPEEGLAVEDAPNGLVSAHSAGMKVVMVPDLSQPDDQLNEMIDCVIPGLNHLVNIVDKF
ncbi:MAG: HAD family phosphatase [Eubacteriales bacterium]|nr:HAD family phosphatase [Eubacteriales bacterium]